MSWMIISIPARAKSHVQYVNPGCDLSGFPLHSDTALERMTIRRILPLEKRRRAKQNQSSGRLRKIGRLLENSGSVLLIEASVLRIRQNL